MKTNLKLNIIANEKISYFNSYCSENIDFKSIIEGLKNNFDICLFARHSVLKKNCIINYHIFLLSNNIFSYLSRLFISLLKKEASKYLIISITPYTFLAYLLIVIFQKRIILYIRSDGFKEYQSILGSRWVFIYAFMYFFMIKKSKVISCVSEADNFYYVRPSEVDSDWLSNRKQSNIDSIKLLYVGRVKIEKGIFSLVNILNGLNQINLTIVGDTFNNNMAVNNNISFKGFVDNKHDLIKIYDQHNIVIVPSFTEAHPKVVDEALSRLRPVIIFDEIKNIIQDRKGIFSINRDKNSLVRILSHIYNNYSQIYEEMKKNILPTKKKFLDDLRTNIKED